MLLSHQHLLFEQSKSLLTMLLLIATQIDKPRRLSSGKLSSIWFVHLCIWLGFVESCCIYAEVAPSHCVTIVTVHCVLKPAQYLYLFGARVNCFCCAILCIWRGFVNLHCTALAV